MSLSHRAVWSRARLILVAGAAVSCVVMLVTELSPELRLARWGGGESIACYDEEEGDALPPAELLRPPPHSIFFHETSCRGGLDARQACAVEAAARAHPRRRVHVLFAAPVRRAAGPLRTLRRLRNVAAARVRLARHVRGTPLEALVASSALNGSRYRVSHSSDVLRYATLLRWGGVYLDLDALVVRPLAPLGHNWAARESDRTVAAGALAFGGDRLGRAVAKAAARELASSFRGDWWGHNGPGVITRVLQRACGGAEVAAMSAAACQGFAVYGPELFYPVRWQDAAYYFEPGELAFPAAYVFHVWNRVTQDTPVRNDSRYANLARTYCPSIFHNHPEEFGVNIDSF